ncbi:MULTISPECIES: hypothetical protein [unclassified Aureispira]|uniref:hypothetical protein n=1 Tax=unclassified Aureispira TaxID=2649989 RepID=UPI0006963161|nr:MULTISPECIES: hypothetical protein [unclassified Aureispira]WMX12951.1 hypothetical protein QP953_19110 [Aureispira sp. CCB-E]
MLYKWILVGSLVSCFFASFAQKKDSIRVVIAMDAANDDIETSYGYWEARSNLKVLIDMYGFSGGVKHLAEQYEMKYDVGEEAWVVTLPKGFFELRVESLGFTDIKSPLRLKQDYRENILLNVDSTSYTYKNRKRYNYIAGTLNFCSTILVQFGSGDPAAQRDFLLSALEVEGFEHISVLRTQKIRHTNAFLVTLAITDRTPLNILLYRKMTKQPEIERGYLIGGDITKAIELFQENSNVLFANPSFLNDPNVVFKNSAKFTKSEQLERKLLGLMEEDSQTLDKINYILDKTTPKEEIE